MNALLRNTLFRLACLAFVVRLIFIFIYPGPNYFEGISRSYLEVAQNVLEGKGFVTYVDIAPLSSPEPHWSYEPFIDRPLGYLLLVLLPYAVSSSPLSIQILHAILSGLSTVLLFLVGKKIVTEKNALRAAWLYALWPLSVRFEIAILPDSVMSFFLLLSLWFLIEALEKEKPLLRCCASGLSLGVGMTMRPDILLLPFFLAGGVLFLKTAHHRMRGIALLFAGVAVVVGAHTVRNYSASGEQIVPLGLGNGISMWEGISQFGDTLGTVFGDERVAELESYRSWGYPDGVERDRRRFREAVQIILDHPVWYAGMIAKRIPVLLTPDWIMTRKFAPSLKEFVDSASERTVWDYVKAYPFPSVIRALLILLQYSSLALAGYAFVKDSQNRLLYFPALIIFYYIVIHIPTNTEARYFYPVIPFVLLLASRGLDLIRNKI